MPSSSMLVNLPAGFSVPALRSRSHFLALGTNLLRNLIFLLFLLRWTRKAALQIKARGLFGTLLDGYRSGRKTVFTLFLKAPGVRSRVQKEVRDAVAKMETKLLPRGLGVARYLALPQVGWAPEQVRGELEKLGEMEHTRWEDGRVSGGVYHGGKELISLQATAFEKFLVSNPIHPDVFPGVRKMEAEVVAMVLAMFNAPPGAAGVMTSGGTESILMACWSAKQKAYHERGITEPEMIIPFTAHAAFLKACSYFHITPHLISCPAPDFTLHIPSVSRYLNGNTILLVASAPSFPHGTIDPIPALARIALHRNIPLHVDACLGSFLLPFLSRAGFPCEIPFDFSVKGVTSISVDTHKYGFAPKGTSSLLYRDQSLRHYQYFIAPDWPGGVYASPSIAGSRPGSLIAACWASMMALGEEGYTASCIKILTAAKSFERALRERPEFRTHLAVLGKPLVSVVAFTTNPTPSSSSENESPNAYDIADRMSRKGWALNALQDPPAVHVAFTLPLSAALDQLLTDLAAVLHDASEPTNPVLIPAASAATIGTEDDADKDKDISSDAPSAKEKPDPPPSSQNATETITAKPKPKPKPKPKKKPSSAKRPQGDMAALYGVAGSLPDKSIVVQLAQGFLDTLYKA